MNGAGPRRYKRRYIVAKKHFPIDKNKSQTNKKYQKNIPLHRQKPQTRGAIVVKFLAFVIMKKIRSDKERDKNRNK